MRRGITYFCFEATRVGMLAKARMLKGADKLALALSVIENAPENALAREGVVKFLTQSSRPIEERGEDLQILGLELARIHCPGADIGMGDMDHYKVADWRKRAGLV